MVKAKSSNKIVFSDATNTSFMVFERFSCYIKYQEENQDKNVKDHNLFKPILDNT